MIKKIKRLSTNVKNLIRKIEILHNKFLQFVKYAKRFGIGVVVYLIIFAFVLVIDNTTKRESKVLDVFTSTNLDNLSIGSDDLLLSDNLNESNIIKEKIAENTHVIFSMEESVMYNTIDASIKTGPELDIYETYKDIKKGTELNVLGYNQYDIAKILYDEKELYIDANLLTNNKDYIFENVDGVVYAKKNTNAYVNLENETENINIVSGEKIHLIGINNSDYSKIEKDNKEYYINKKDISDSSSYVFEQENKTMYTKETINIMETQDDDSNALTTVKKGTKIDIIGTNDSNFYKVKFNDFEGYVLKDKLTEKITEIYPTTRTVTSAESESAIEYYPDNVKDGVMAVVPEDQMTEENIYLLAKLIYCEAGGQGYEGQRAVATVVVNRMHDKRMGDTVHNVIYRSGQFSPVGSGKIENVIPTEANIEAAEDVLINGYRSFPVYVLYFQSIRDGYFGGHSTYCTTYNNDWTHPQYFSYKNSDYEKYKN